MDNCSGQNKNWVLFTALVQIVNQVFGPERIILRYLTKGHTHNAAEGIHGNFEVKMKKMGKIHDFGDLLTCVNISRKGVNTITMDNSFRNWTSKKRACTKTGAVASPECYC